ncbi:MAG: cyclic nucleotide-binding domain-containing protein [Chloroflexi bacterium]|nr:cyclic nucleotide-binding domain-containing protein [Chloroflexota bacterium]
MANRLARSQLRQLALFQHLAPQHIDLISDIVQTKQIEPGEVIFGQGQPTQGLYLFVAGRAILIRTDPSGAEMALGEVGRGEYINERALYETGIETASLRAAEPTMLLLLTRAALLTLLAEHPDVRAALGERFAAPAPQPEEKPRLFRGQRPEEIILHIFRRHWWAIVRNTWIVGVVGIVGLLLAHWVSGTSGLIGLIVGIITLALMGGLLYYLYYEWQDDGIIITDQRVIRVWNTLLTFQNNVSEIPLNRVLEVNAEIPPGNPFAQIFRFGSIHIRTAGQAGTVSLNIIPTPERVQAAIFAERDRFRSQVEKRAQDVLQAEVGRAIGIDTAEIPAVGPEPTAAPPQLSPVGPRFARTRFINADGDLVYRKHLRVWASHIMLPALVILGGLIALVAALSSNVLTLVTVPLAFVILLGGIGWFYISDWDWRNDTYVLGSNTITLTRMRPLWLQNQVDQISLSQIDNVVSEVNGLINTLFNWGRVEIYLIGANPDEGKVIDMIYDPPTLREQISTRQEAIKAQQQAEEQQEQRASMQAVLAAYHKLTTDEVPGSPPPGAPNPGSANAPPPRPDGIRPPTVPRIRPD